MIVGNLKTNKSKMPVFHTKTIESILEPVASQVSYFFNFQIVNGFNINIFWVCLFTFWLHHLCSIPIYPAHFWSQLFLNGIIVTKDWRIGYFDNYESHSFVENNNNYLCLRKNNMYILMILFNQDYMKRW